MVFTSHKAPQLRPANTEKFLSGSFPKQSCCRPGKACRAAAFGLKVEAKC